MKICIVSSEYPPFHGGGIGTYSANMGRFLAEAGHEVHIVANRWAAFGSTAEGEAGLLEQSPNLHIHRIDALTPEYTPRPPHDSDESQIGQVCRQWDSSLYWSMHAADTIEQLHREHGLDVVEFPECFAESYLAMRRRRLGIGDLDLPMTLTLHSPILEVIRYNLYREYEAWFQRRVMMEEYCIRNADMLSSPSRHLQDTVYDRMQLDPDVLPCDVIHNPMDFDSLAVEAGDAPGEPERDTLLFVGRLEPRKGLTCLIDAVVKVMPDFPELSLRLIGRDCEAGSVPGKMKDHLLQRIPDNFRERFIFEGLWPRQKVVRQYSSATACVFAAPWDNFPYTCCEAMASGACVIASDNSGMAEMVEHEESGILFQAANVAELASAIRRVLRDEPLRKRIQGNARERIQKVTSPQTAVEKRLAHYEKTIERHRQSRRDPKRLIPDEKRASGSLPWPSIGRLLR